MIERPVGIACFGTSLTTGRLSGSWPIKLQNKLNGVARRRVICYDVGQGSQTSAWGVANIDRPRNHRPDICLIEFSINDAVTANGISIAQATTNLLTIVNALRAVNPAMLIYLMTMNGVPDLTLRPNLEAYYQNDRDFAAANGCGLIDIRTVWGTPNYTDTPDGLHPSEAAVDAKLLPTVFNVLAPIVAAVTLPTTPPALPPNPVSVSPASGPPAGGTTITLSGSNLTGVTGVTIGGVAATSVTVVNASTVTCVTPAGTGSARDIVVTSPAGSGTLAGAFSYSSFSSSVSYVTGGNGSFSGSTFSFTPAGLAVGDWMFVVADGVSATSVTGGSGGTWTRLTLVNAGNFTSTLFYRQMTAGDVGATFTINGGTATGPAEWVVYRGATAVVAAQTQVSAANASTLGFSAPSLSAQSSRLLAVLSEHGSAGAGSWSAPANWAARVAWNQYGPKWLGDIPSSVYPGGGITFTTSVTQAAGQVGWLFELIGT